MVTGSRILAFLGVFVSSKPSNNKNCQKRVQQQYICDKTLIRTSISFMAVLQHASGIIFPPEVDVTSIQLTSRRVWSLETPLDTVLPQTAAHNVVVQGRIISKPAGEVNEISKGGYSLHKVLDWEKGRYKDVQVRHFIL